MQHATPAYSHRDSDHLCPQCLLLTVCQLHSVKIRHYGFHFRLWEVKVDKNIMMRLCPYFSDAPIEGGLLQQIQPYAETSHFRQAVVMLLFKVQISNRDYNFV